VFYFLVLFYFITFKLKDHALTVADISAELRVIFWNKICKNFKFFRFVNSAHDSQFCTGKILQVWNCRTCEPPDLLATNHRV